MKTYSHLSLKRWCRPVFDGKALMEGDNVYLKYQDGGFEPFGPPDVVFEEERAAVEQWRNFSRPATDPIGFALDSTELFPYLTRDFSVFVEDAFIASLSNVCVQRPNFNRDRYLVLLDDGIVAAETHGAAFFADKFSGLLGEMKALNVNGQPLPIRLYQDLPVDTVYEEPCILLCDIWMHNYFHWLLEVLSRMWFIEATPELADVPVVVPEYPAGSFQEQMLSAALGTRKRIPFPGTSVRFKKLYFPTMIAPGGYSSRQSRWVDGFLRQRLGLPKSGGKRRILVSRKDAQVRRVLNEDALLEQLAPLGFESHVLSGLSLRDQIKLFGEAEFVIAPHGAGCANLIFTPPGARVIELMPSSARHPMFWMISKQCGHHFGRITVEDDGPYQGMAVNPVALEAMVRHLLDKP